MALARAGDQGRNGTVCEERGSVDSVKGGAFIYVLLTSPSPFFHSVGARFLSLGELERLDPIVLSVFVCSQNHCTLY